MKLRLTPYFKTNHFRRKFMKICQNKPQAAPLRFAPRHRGGGLERICRAEVDIRTAASPRGETIAVQRSVFMILQAPRRFRFAEVVRQAFLQCHEG